MQVPNVHDAEPIPESARAAIEALLRSGDLFRYTAPEAAPVSLLEAEFADLIGANLSRVSQQCGDRIGCLEWNIRNGGTRRSASGSCGNRNFRNGCRSRRRS